MYSIRAVHPSWRPHTHHDLRGEPRSSTAPLRSSSRKSLNLSQSLVKLALPSRSTVSTPSVARTQSENGRANPLDCGRDRLSVEQYHLGASTVRTRNVGPSHDIANPFFLPLFKAIRQHADVHNLRLFRLVGRKPRARENSLFQRLASQMDGICLAPSVGHSCQNFNDLQSGLPI